MDQIYRWHYLFCKLHLYQSCSRIIKELSWQYKFYNWNRKRKQNYIDTAFKHQNIYPSWVIHKVITQIQQGQKYPANTVNGNENDNKKIQCFLLPCQGDEGCNIIKSLNKRVNKLFPKSTKIEATFKSTKLSSSFNVKDKIHFEHNHNLIYHTKCPEPTCINVYVG